MLEQAIIIGAGFSCYAGLPLQAAFTTAAPARSALHKRTKQAPRRVPLPIRERYLPSARGAHLIAGLISKTSLPASISQRTRATTSGTSTHRRSCATAAALIARTIRMFSQAYDAQSEARRELARPWRHCLRTSRQNHAFISLNWDTVAEERMLELHAGTYDPVRPEASSQRAFPRAANISTLRPKPSTRAPRCKNSRSTNWLVLRQLQERLLVQPTGIPTHRRPNPQQGRMAMHRAKITCQRERTTRMPQVRRRCAEHKNRDVQLPQSPRLPHVPPIWNNAEQILTTAKRWVFIGYLLPSRGLRIQVPPQTHRAPRAPNRRTSLS